MSKLSPQQFKDYLMQIRRLAEGPLEEIQKEVEVTNKFPQEFYDLPLRMIYTAARFPKNTADMGCRSWKSFRYRRNFPGDRAE